MSTGGRVSNDAIIQALTVEDASSLEVPEAASFRQLADALGADREALAAQARSVYRGEIALGRISAPTLLLAGSTDPLAIRPQVLADGIPDATLGILTGNHIESAGRPALRESRSSSSSRERDLAQPVVDGEVVALGGVAPGTGITGG